MLSTPGINLCAGGILDLTGRSSYNYSNFSIRNLMKLSTLNSQYYDGLIMRIILTTLLLLFGIVFQCTADEFMGKLDILVESHKRILAAKSTLKSFDQQLSIANKAWFPEISTTAFYGYEKRNLAKGRLGTTSPRDTSLPPHELDLTITQPLLDFGTKSSALEIAKTQVEQSKITLDATLQSILLEAISAQVNFNSTTEIERYAKRSVSNIKRQAKLEDARVSIGSGFSTDVLQAKAQLAGAEARYTLAKGARSSSKNRYRSVFGSLPDKNETLDKIEIPSDQLPSSIDIAVARSLKNNVQVRLLELSRDQARAGVEQTLAIEFYPTVNLIFDTKYKHDVSGTSGTAVEFLLKGELKYSFNLGGTSFNNVAAVKANYYASMDRLLDAKNLIEEQARNAYEQLKITKTNAQFLRNQANISGEFLQLARKERRLGRRSLLDVLSGETVEISASSDAANAESQVIIAAYSMLFIMGDLSIERIKIKSLK